MKTLSRLAFAAVLASGLGTTALVAPAVAQKKGKAPAGPTLTPAVQKAAAEAQKAMQAGDMATAETQLVATEAAAAPSTNEYDKYVAAALRYDFETSKMRTALTANPNAPIDQTVLMKPLEVLIANPLTPAEARPQYLFRRGTLAFNARQFPQAVQYYEQARTAGYKDPELDLQIAKAKLEGPDVKGGLADLNGAIERQVAAGQKPPESFYRYGIQRANAAKMGPETLVWLKKWIAAYPTAKNWRDVIFVYGLQPGSIAKLDNQQQIDLFRLLRASKSLADQYDYREYAQKVYDRGLPAEAQTVLAEGFASGKLTGNGDAKSLQTAAANAQRNESPLGTLATQAKASANGKLASQTGDAYLGQDKYAEAAALYRVALQKGGVNADEVNTRLGIALARSGDKAGAQAAFGAVSAGPRADIAALWTTWLTTPSA
ncbi:hypothetical protein [Sphingomonas sp.]|uniref:hypothetical protein n=1 Tax=Sphingomonas sp. TaxID=28214 RepID=UPI002EDA3CBE